MKMTWKTVGWIVMILLTVHYFYNRYPGLAFIDSGELALCSLSYGVPHPTGYPLYMTLTAPIASLGDRPVAAVTIFSALLTALAGFAFFHLLAAIRKYFKPAADRLHVIPALLTLTVFLSPVITDQGTTNEVYGLALLINIVCILSMIRAWISPDRHQRLHYLILTWFIAGIAMTDHMSSIFLFPAMAMVTCLLLRKNKTWRYLPLLPLASIIPLTIYAVLPIRAAADPVPIISWGDITTWNNFYRHISGWQFRVWMFTSDFVAIWGNIKNLAGLIFRQFPPVLLIFSVVGIYDLFRKSKPLVAAMILMMLVNIGFGINYIIPDIESYFLPTIIILGLFGMIGVYFLARRVNIGLAVGIISAVLVWQVIAVADENYKGDYTLPDDYAHNILNSADSGAVVISEIWDHLGQAFYLQQAEGFRPDLRLIDKELLRRSWYYKTIRQVYPDIYDRIADLVPPFLSELAVFESGGDFNANALEYYYQAIINRILTRCGTAYIDHNLIYTPAGNHYLRPQGVLLRLDTLAINEPLPQPTLIWHGRPFDAYTDTRARVHIKILSDLGITH